MWNFVIREISLKLYVTREFCKNWCVKRDHDPPFATLIVLYTMTKFTLENETSKVSLGNSPTLYVTLFCHESNICYNWFWRLYCFIVIPKHELPLQAT